MKFSGNPLFFLFFLAVLNMAAQSPADSLRNSIRTKIYSESSFDRQSSVFTSPDSSLNAIQNYRNRYNLGNSGLAITNLYFPQVEKTVGFNYAPNNFDAYLFLPHTTDYFNTRTP